MTITNLLSNVNTDNILLHSTQICSNQIKHYIDHTSNGQKFMWKNRKKFLRSNYCLLLCVLFLLSCLLINQRVNTRKPNGNQRINQTDVDLFIDRIKEHVILDRNFIFNLEYNLTSNDIPKWLNLYGITHMFNYYWLQNGAYLWHLQRLTEIKQSAIDVPRTFSQRLQNNFNQTNLFEFLNHHPEYGIMIDTASDPVQPLFSPLPRASLSLEQTCQHYPWLNDWYPCQRRSKMISSVTFQPLISYALYDVTIDLCDQCKLSSGGKTIYYDEVIYLFNSLEQIKNEIVFVKQILPRLIRLLALVPQTAYILLPYWNTTMYINQYIDVLIERGIITDKKRFIEYNSSQIYHANVVYSTSSPRSDLILLNKILIGDKPPVRRELILIIRNNLDDHSYNEIVQAIHQFELPDDFAYLRVQEYQEDSYNLKQIRDFFQQARIVIGMPTDILSHIVWCLPRTHIIEIIQKTMTTDYYDISLQLQFNYWIVMTTATNTIDTIDFRNLMMRVFMDIDA